MQHTHTHTHTHTRARARAHTPTHTHHTHFMALKLLFTLHPVAYLHLTRVRAVLIQKAEGPMHGKVQSQAAAAPKHGSSGAPLRFPSLDRIRQAMEIICVSPSFSDEMTRGPEMGQIFPQFYRELVAIQGPESPSPLIPGRNGGL